MIRVNGVTLSQADQFALAHPLDLGELVAAHRGPDLPPFKIDLAPGTLYWPQGAARFAVGQYVAVSDDLDAILDAVDDDPAGNPVELKLGGGGTGEPELTFQMHLLCVLPLQFEYLEAAWGAPSDFRKGVHLLVLVDYRYFLQTTAPTWTITDGTTTWSDLEAAVESALGVDIAWSGLASFFTALKPGAPLAAPPLASDGVVSGAGGLLDAISTARGERFVALPDGTFASQSAIDANASFNTDYARAYTELRHGGDLAAHTADGQTDAEFLFPIPQTVSAVFPRVSAGVEVAPTVVSCTYPLFTGSASQYTRRRVLFGGTLRVPTTCWVTGTSGTLTNFVQAWTSSWWSWLNNPGAATYTGLADFTPCGRIDSARWVTTRADTRTEVLRGLINPAVPTLHVTLGVAPPAPLAPDNTIEVGGYPAIDTITPDPVYIQVAESPPGTLSWDMAEAGAGQGGVLTAVAQEVQGAKTFLDGVVIAGNWFGGSVAQVYFDLSGTTAAITMTTAGNLSLDASGISYFFGPSYTGHAFVTPGGQLAIIEDAGMTLDTGQVYAVGGAVGATGTDSNGSTFVGGICTSIS